MRRIEIYVDEKIDEALRSEAIRTGRSKASLIRECVAERYAATGPVENDPISGIVGSVDAEPEEVDDEVYGR